MGWESVSLVALTNRSSGMESSCSDVDMPCWLEVLRGDSLATAEVEGENVEGWIFFACEEAKRSYFSGILELA